MMLFRNSSAIHLAVMKWPSFIISMLLYTNIFRLSSISRPTDQSILCVERGAFLTRCFSDTIDCSSTRNMTIYLRFTQRECDERMVLLGTEWRMTPRKGSLSRLVSSRLVAVWFGQGHWLSAELEGSLPTKFMWLVAASVQIH